MTTRQGLLAGLSLVLLASLVIGSDNARRETHVSALRAAPGVSALPQTQPATSEELEVEKLQRSRHSEPIVIVDVFAQKAPPVPAPLPAQSQPAAPEPAVAAAPPAPPALPFRLVGKFVEKGALRLLLANGEKEHDVSGGETLEGTYRVDSVSEESVAFTYLPLNAPQTLALTPAGEAGR